ncbi:MAG: radical SAM protein [Verrucomicrobiae bacterium]|nr:radical SAM protein [Verrucomicrobiae bacterium]
MSPKGLRVYGLLAALCRLAKPDGGIDQTPRLASQSIPAATPRIVVLQEPLEPMTHLDTHEKLKILSADSQYDLACACGTSDHDRRHRGLEGRWLYPVTLANGGQSIMLKTLMSNACRNDCKYCPLRSQTNIRRCSLAPEETAGIFMNYLRRMTLYGLFLSSGVTNSPDHTMAQLNETAWLLRRKHDYRGYIHLKVLPGASDAAIEETLSLASAVSINIETPGAGHFAKLSQRKDYLADIIRPLKLISRLTARGERHARVRTTTQFIVGASDEKDSEIVNYLFGLYNRLHLNRVYFSAYQPGLGTSDIPGEKQSLQNPGSRLMREHRLYQVDFLVRQYGFKAADFHFDQDNNLPLDKDPKQIWAERHPGFFPINVNRADRETLLRVPGIGPRTVKTILQRRQLHKLGDTSDLGLKGKRRKQAEPFICFAS